jgi:heme-degrading monooxygenase HmoA
VNNPNIFFTYSFWQSQNDLEKYRNSALFKEVWSKTKKMFAEKAQAWSTEILTQSNIIKQTTND